MRHAHNEAKPRGSFVQRMVAALAAIAMLGGLGYVTTSSAIAEDDTTRILPVTLPPCSLRIVKALPKSKVETVISMRCI